MYLCSIDPPDVSVSATRTRLPVSESTTLNCSVASSNPSTFTVMWTLMNTNDVTMTLSETGQILVVSDIGEDDFGTYTCNVTNSANLSGTAELTIEQGGMYCAFLPLCILISVNFHCPCSYTWCHRS